MTSPTRASLRALSALVVAVMGAGVVLLATRAEHPSDIETKGEPAETRKEDQPVSPLSSCAEVVQSVAAGSSGQAQPVPAKPATAAAQIRAIALEVERIRELRFSRPVTPKFVTPQELSRRVAASVEKEYPVEDARADNRILVLLGAISPSANLKDLIQKAYSEQVIGFYDSDTEEIVVGTQDPSALLSPLARLTLAHELDHALTDQVLHLPDIAENSKPGGEDAALAALALIEGDATMLMQLYAATSLSLKEQTAIVQDPSLAGAKAEEADLPHYLRQALEFPYLTGLAFNCELFRSVGRWDEVNKAYKEPPKTTAQIIFPARYREAELAVDPLNAGKPSEPWKAEAFRAIGAADLMWLFQAPGMHDKERLTHPALRAAAWMGGELQLFTKGAESALGISLIQRDRNGPLCESMVEWYTRTFPKDKKISARRGEALAVDGRTQDAVVVCTGRLVRIGIAPDPATARALVRQI